MGKTKVIAETGAGQHGVATATGAALFNMECTVYMGAEDMKRQSLNVMRMEMLGAKVVPVTSGSNTLKDATNEAIRTWAKTAEDTFYVIGSAVGPYPYPKMVKYFQSVISKEAKKQILEQEGRLPDVVMACVGGGSNSIGMFVDFIEEKINEIELQENIEIVVPTQVIEKTQEFIGTTTSIENLFNSQSFRDFVMVGYGNKCAVTGKSIVWKKFINLEAAHIMPKSHNGTYMPNNGLALSRDIHLSLIHI